MLTGMRVIKRAIQVIAAAFLLAMFGYPLAGAWLAHHPDTQAALDDAADNVDPEAGFFTRARQFVSGVSKSREVAAEEQRERAEEKLIDKERRKQDELRRFNTGQLAQEDT